MQDKDKDELLRLLERQEDFKKVFGTPEGERVLTYLKEKGSLRNTIYHGDTALMYILEGQRRVVLTILDYIEMSAEELKQRFIAQLERKQRNDGHFNEPTY